MALGSQFVLAGVNYCKPPPLPSVDSKFYPLVLSSEVGPPHGQGSTLSKPHPKYNPEGPHGRLSVHNTTRNYYGFLNSRIETLVRAFSSGGTGKLDLKPPYVAA